MGEKRDVGEVARFSVTIRVGVIAFILAAIVVGLYIWFSDPDQRSVFSFIVAAGAAAGGVTAAYYVGAGVRDSARAQEALREQQRTAHEQLLAHQTRTEKVQRFFALAATWSDPAFGPARNTISRLLDSFKQTQTGPAQRARDIETAIEEEAEADRDIESPGVRRSLRLTLDYLEGVALAVNREEVDEELARRLLRSAVITYATILGPWIKVRRDKIAQPSLYEELFKLAERWK